jgi:hypothetical protein
MPTFRNPLSVPSSKAEVWVWLEVREQWYLYGKPAGLESGGTNREQVAGVGGSTCRNRLWRGRYISGKSERDHTSAFEDGSDRGFRNVGIYIPDAGELP